MKDRTAGLEKRQDRTKGRFPALLLSPSFSRPVVSIALSILSSSLQATHAAVVDNPANETAEAGHADYADRDRSNGDSVAASGIVNATRNKPRTHGSGLIV